jgi:hypothetical protein
MSSTALPDVKALMAIMFTVFTEVALTVPRHSTASGSNDVTAMNTLSMEISILEERLSWMLVQLAELGVSHLDLMTAASGHLLPSQVTTFSGYVDLQYKTFKQFDSVRTSSSKSSSSTSAALSSSASSSSAPTKKKKLKKCSKGGKGISSKKKQKKANKNKDRCVKEHKAYKNTVWTRGDNSEGEESDSGKSKKSSSSSSSSSSSGDKKKKKKDMKKSSSSSSSSSSSGDKKKQKKDMKKKKKSKKGNKQNKKDEKKKEKKSKNKRKEDRRRKRH